MRIIQRCNRLLCLGYAAGLTALLSTGSSMGQELSIWSNPDAQPAAQADDWLVQDREAALVESLGDSAATNAFGLADLTATTVGAYDFEPWSGTTVTSILGITRSVATSAAGSTFATVIAPLNLPSGALVESMELEACDDSATGAITAELGVCPALSEACAAAGSVTTGSGSAQGCNTFTVPINPQITIDNLNSSYYVSINDPDLSTTTRWRAVRVYWRRQVSPAPSTATFSDVPTSHPFFQEIEALVGSGITLGCGGGRYCPTNVVTREQMAAFLARGFGLHFAP